MSTNEREKMMMAYIDGELSVAEAHAFDASLTEEERERLAAEMKVENAVSECLCESVKCPVEMWNDLQRQLKAKDVQRSSLPRYVMLAATILMVLGASLMYSRGLNPAQIPDYVVHGIHLDMDGALENFSDAIQTAATTEDVERYLQDHGIQLALADYGEQSPHSHHSLTLLGSCEGACPEGTLVEIRFECCNHPAKLVVAKQGTGGAFMIEKAIASGKVQDSLHIDGYVAGVVGDHHAEDLLHLLRKKPGKLA